MAIMLLYEQQKRQQSVVSGYVDQMPATFDTLLHWSSEELQLLMYPHLIQQVISTQATTLPSDCIWLWATLVDDKRLKLAS